MPPSLPKSLGVFCKPSPKCHCQSRLTATRANSGFSGAVSQSENASIRPSRKSIFAGANGQPGCDFVVLLRPVGIAAGQDVALLQRLFRIDLDGPERRQTDGRGRRSPVELALQAPGTSCARRRA